jgi:hypothetical protein
MQEPSTFSGAKFYIGTTAAATNQTQFEADVYTEITNLSNFGEMGGSANVLQFPVVSDLYVKKQKGVRNGGDPAIVVGRISEDAGQIKMRQAEQTKYYYNFKLELEDAEDEFHTNTVFYFRAIVASVLGGFGGNEDFVTETYNLGIYPGPLIVESAIISSP